MLNFPRIFYLISAITFVSTLTFGITVNRLNGGLTIRYIDFSIPAQVVPMELVRSYNSILALNENHGWRGSFGWGWTSPFESTLVTTPERVVLLRDGETGNTIHFRAEKSDPKIKEKFFEEARRAYFVKTMRRKPKDYELVHFSLPPKILSRLKSDPKYRVEFANLYGMKDEIPLGELLISNEYGYETLLLRNRQWIREKNGITSIFDTNGNLIRQFDKSGVSYEYSYNSQKKLSQIIASNQSASLKLTTKGDEVTEITDNKGRKSKYQYDDKGNLTQSIDSNQLTYVFKYENKKFPHLITSVHYPSDKTSRQFSFDDNGLLTQHRDKNGTLTKYVYGRDPSDPENKFWTKSTIETNGKITEEYDEFLLKSRPDGTKFLSKQESKEPGATSTTIFTPCCGKPSQITRNGIVTTFKYDDMGRLKEKSSPQEMVKFNYDPKWKKVSQVTQNGDTYSYKFDKEKGYLISGVRNNKEKISLSYDSSGRVLAMVDPDGRRIVFQHGENGRKVSLTEKGIGGISIEYDEFKRIKKAEAIREKKPGRKLNDAESKEIVSRILKSFSRILDIIRPAGESITLG